MHKPGGRKGRPCFEVTMEVPGMQVSRKVDSVGWNRQLFALCDSAAPPEVLLSAFRSQSLNQVGSDDEQCQLPSAQNDAVFICFKDVPACLTWLSGWAVWYQRSLDCVENAL